MSDFVPFEEASGELGIEPEKLKEEIASGKIRAFSDAGTFKIRRADLDRYKEQQAGELTIVLPADPGEAGAGAGGDETIEMAVELDPETVEEEIEMIDLEAVGETAEGAGIGETESLVDGEILDESSVGTADTLPELDLSDLEADDLSVGDAPATVDLSGGAPPTEEVLLESDDPVEILPLDDAGLSDDEGDTLTSEMTKPIEIGTSEPTVGMATDPMEIGDDRPSRTIGRRSTGGTLAYAAGPQLSAAMHARKTGHPAWAVVAVLAMAVMVFTGGILIGYRPPFVYSYLKPLLGWVEVPHKPDVWPPP